MEDRQKLNLAEFAIWSINNFACDFETPDNIRLIGIRAVIDRYNLYKKYPDHIPPNVIEKINK